jgi:hypothetical protein
MRLAQRQCVGQESLRGGMLLISQPKQPASRASPGAKGHPDFHVRGAKQAQYPNHLMSGYPTRRQLPTCWASFVLTRRYRGG